MEEKDLYKVCNNNDEAYISSTESVSKIDDQNSPNGVKIDSQIATNDVQNISQNVAQNVVQNTMPTSIKNDKKSHKIAKLGTRAVAYIGISTAMVFVATLIGFSSSQFYFNFGDSVILLISALLGPISAMLAGGLGAFFADMAVYPATMLYTLVIKAIEGLVAGVLFKPIFKHYDRLALKSPLTKRQQATKIILSLATMLLSASIMMCGYFICQTFFYGTINSALVALPMDFAQASISTFVAMVALYPLKLVKFHNKLQVHI